MIDLKTINKIYISPGYTDLRIGIDGLTLLVKNKLNEDPFDGSLFIFCNRTRDRIKILHFEYNGFWVYYKRFETGKIKWPLNEINLCITTTDFKWLLQGLLIRQKPMKSCESRLII